MNLIKFILLLAISITFHRLYAGNPISVKQFINHKDWSFVENKGQISTPLSAQAGNPSPEHSGGTAANNMVKYYGHQGGVYLYCKAGMLSFVFTKVEKEAEQISEATGSVSDVGVQNSEPLHRKQPFDLQRSLLSALPSSISTSRTDLILLNSNPSAQILASDQQEYYENFYTTPEGSGQAGNADSGITNVHTYKTITYKNIYPHIDMVLYARPQGMKYEFVVYPGGKVSDIQMQWVGLEGIKKFPSARAGKNFGIEYSCSLGKIEESAPYSYVGAGFTPALDGEINGESFDEKGDGKGRPHVSNTQKIESHFILNNNRVSFKADRYDKSKILVIDPTLVWGTYFGGGGQDIGLGVATDDSEHVYITGQTASTTNIATSGAFQTSYGGGARIAFLAKFDSNGLLLWSTYFGGNNGEQGFGVAVDLYGNIYITGTTQSKQGIATSGAYQTSYGGGINAFISKFNGRGSLQWATYYGGIGGDYVSGITSDLFGNISITGFTTSSSGIATKGAYQTSLTGSAAFFLAKFNMSGAIQWGTYYNVSGITPASNAIASDKYGNLLITGWVDSDAAPLTYLVKFNSGGARLWAVNVNSVCNLLEIVSNGLATNKSGDVYLTGYCYISGDYVLLAKFNEDGSFQWVKKFGSGSDVGNGVTADDQGNAYITGYTSSPTGIATNGAYQANLVGSSNAFLAKFGSTGTKLWSTYYGGNYDHGNAIAADGGGHVYITGVTGSNTNIVTNGAWQIKNGGNSDAFLAKFDFNSSNDAGVSSIINSNSNACSDSQIVKVVIHNYGLTVLDSVEIGLSINGGLASFYQWVGTLLPKDSTSVILGKYLFSLGKNTIKAWTFNPNGVKDSVSENDTSSSSTIVIPLPAANTGPNQVICEHSSLSIGATSVNGDTYLWTSNPHGYSSTISNPYFNNVSGSGSTIFYLTETNTAGCSKTDSVLITINPSPPDILVPNTGICIGDSIGLTDSLLNGFHYEWRILNSGVIFSTLSNPVVKPTITTSYIIRLVNIKTGCWNIDSVKITVNPLPIPNTGQSSYKICTGTHIKIGANAKPGIAYLWTSTPAGFSSTLANPVVNPGNNTVYNLSVTDTATGCTNKNSADVIVSIAQAPVIDVGKNQTICAGISAQIGSGALSGDIYSWTSNPTGFTSTLAQLIITPKQTTSYSLTVTNTTGCTNFDSVTITVNPLPQAVAGKTIYACSGTKVRFGIASGFNYIYSWTSNPPGFVSNQSEPYDSPTITTIYYLKVTNPTTGCMNSDSIEVAVMPRPNVVIQAIHTGGFEYQFRAQNPNYPSSQYYWDFGDTSSTSSTGSDTVHGYIVNHIYPKNGKYIVTLFVGGNVFCHIVDTITIDLNEQFSLNIYPNPFHLQTDIHYTLVNPAHVRISLTDEIGRQLGTLLDKQLNQGEYLTTFDGAAWKTRPAMYFVIFQLDDKVIVKKIIQLDSIYY